MLDAYSRRARLAPLGLLLLTLFPTSVWMLTFLPGFYKLGAGAWLVLAYLGEELGRQKGRALQDGLWESWGGSPTLQLMRWHGPDSTARVAARHQSIAALVNVPLPDRTAETRDPAGADDIYEVAISRVLAATREGNPVLLAENAGYGFRRNCLGLRTIGQWTAFGAILLGLLALFSDSWSGKGIATAQVAVGALSLTFWTLIVNEHWVRTQADAYAQELFKTVDRMMLRSKVDKAEE